MENVVYKKKLPVYSNTVRMRDGAESRYFYQFFGDLLFAAKAQATFKGKTTIPAAAIVINLLWEKKYAIQEMSTNIHLHCLCK